MPKEPKEPKFCSVPECGEKHHAKGLCSHHYSQMKSLPAAIKRVSGGTLCCQINPESEHGRQWFTMPDGKSFSGSMAERLIADRTVVPVGDGLFGDAQTYEIAR